MTTFTGPETGGCRLEQTRASTLLSSYKYSCSPRVHWYTHKNLAQRQNYTSAHTTNVICRVCVCLYVCVQQVVRGYRSLKGSRGDGWKARGTSKRDWPCKPSSNKVDSSLLAALTLVRLSYPLFATKIPSFSFSLSKTCLRTLGTLGNDEERIYLEKEGLSLLHFLYALPIKSMKILQEFYPFQ